MICILSAKLDWKRHRWPIPRDLIQRWIESDWNRLCAFQDASECAHVSVHYNRVPSVGGTSNIDDHAKILDKNGTYCNKSKQSLVTHAKPVCHLCARLACSTRLNSLEKRHIMTALDAASQRKLPARERVYWPVRYLFKPCSK